jgi:hypothetical protein
MMFSVYASHDGVLTAFCMFIITDSYIANVSYNLHNSTVLVCSHRYMYFILYCLVNRSIPLGTIRPVSAFVNLRSKYEGLLRNSTRTRVLYRT